MNQKKNQLKKADFCRLLSVPKNGKHIFCGHALWRKYPNEMEENEYSNGGNRCLGYDLSNLKKNCYSELGITLIALVVTIVILVILAAIVLRTFTGTNSLIDTTMDVATESEIAKYKGMLDEKVRSIIIDYSIRGLTPKVTDIAKELIKEDWVISAIPNADEETSEADIIVTVENGYVYDIFYDSIYGKINIDYIGKIDPSRGSAEDLAKLLPKLKLDYEPITAIITATASSEEGEIEKVEIIYKGEVKETVENRDNSNPFIAQFNVGDTSVYEPRMVSSKGYSKRHRIYKNSVGVCNNIIRNNQATKNNSDTRKSRWKDRWRNNRVVCK